MKKQYSVTIFIVLLILQCWFLYVTFHFPLIGLNLNKNQKNEWVIESLDSVNISKKFNIDIGDKIIKVNDIDADDYFSIRNWKTIDQAKKVQVLSKGQAITILIENESSSYVYDIVPLVIELISILVAIILFKKLSHSYSAQILSLLFLNIGLIFMSLGGSVRGDIIGKTIITPLIMLLPILFLQFLIVFVKEKGNFHFNFKFIKYLYYWVGLFFLLYLIISWIPIISSYKIYPIMINTGLAFAIFVTILNLIFIFKMYVKYRNDKTYMSTIIKTIGVSMFVSLSPMIFFSFIPRMIYGYEAANSLYLGCFVLFIPLTFAYLLATKKLYDINLVLRRVVFSIIISVFPSILVVVLNTIIFQNDASSKHIALSFIATTIIFSFIIYSFEYFVSRLEPIMFPRKHQLQKALKKISQTLGSISNFRELKEIILVDIVNTLEVFGGAIIFQYHQSIEVISEGEIDETELEALVSNDDLTASDYTCLTIQHHEEYTSYLIISKKKNNTMLGMEDTQWLQLIISYLQVSLENIYLMRKLSMKLEQIASQIPNKRASKDFVWFRKLMFELQEQERVRIATDIHDTTMQDLFFLKRKIHRLLDKYDSQEAMSEIKSLVQYVEIINMNLRQNCFELHPYLLHEKGLIFTLQKMMERESLSAPFLIEFMGEQAGRVEQEDIETKKHIFRMVQEFINNAKKHSEATKVQVKLQISGNVLHLMYSDNGVGFDAKIKKKREIGSSGIGMEQLRSRVLHLNGHMELETSKGRGVSIRITLPIETGMTA